jgi:hypothetical protein
MPVGRSHTPLAEFPAELCRSPPGSSAQLLGQQFHPRAYDFPPFHSGKLQPQPSHLSSNQYDGGELRIKNELPSTPPPTPMQVCTHQGDQIGQIFAHWVTVYFGMNFFKK